MPTPMKKNSRISDAYANLNRLARGPMTPETTAEIRRTIANPSSLLVSKAVDITADLGLRELAPEMAAAFAKFVEDGAKTDKGCRAKTSIAKALNALDYCEDEVFLAGVFLVQMEAAFGTPEDTAVEVRSE